jgi:MoxR-like ATPase
LHLYIPYPTIDQEIAIILMKIPQIKKKLAARMVEFIQTLRKMPLKKTPSIAETLDWVKTLILLNSEMDRKAVAISLSVLLKYEQDVATVEKKLDSLLPDNPDTEEDEAFAEEPPVNEKKHEQPEWLSRFEF